MENGDLLPTSPSRDELQTENARLRPQLTTDVSGDSGFAILDRVSDAVVSVDLEKRVTYLNPTAEREYGVTCRRDVGPVADQMLLCQWSEPSGEKASCDGLRKRGHWRGQNFHAKRNGSVVYMDSTVSVLLGPDGTPVSVLAAIRDIALTGYGVDSDRERCRSAGFDEHLTMPADLDTLGGWINALPYRRFLPFA